MSTATAIRVAFPSQAQVDVADLEDDEKVPPPRYRHAAPSAPWPWMDFDKDDAHVAPLSPGPKEPWAKYPQSHFGNWTPEQVARCRMVTICQDRYACQISKVDVFKDASFDKSEDSDRSRQIPSDPMVVKDYWEELRGPLDSRLRVRALFIENITFDVLRVLGARYNIEPFFFASSANWIPSRYQEDPHYGQGDHITVVLPFIRAVKNERERISPTPSNPSNETRYPPEKGPEKAPAPLTDTKQTIDTQAPLVLSDEKILLQDLLAIHMVRHRTENVIISYHHSSKLQKTTAGRLRSLVQRTGDSVYWSKLYHRSEDPTFLFLAILWYALYAWDEALEVLYAHLTEQLEANTDSTTTLNHTRELHKLQAHLLYYQQLLRDFRKSVDFVKNTPNPAMDEDPGQHDSMELLKREADNLLSEIERLERQRQIQSERLKNAIDLSFSTVNIEDSKNMQSLSKATLRDSAAMKQISYLTMIFLPATYLSSVFGMNVAEINPGTLESLRAYIESTIILTVITSWIAIALQTHSSFHPGGRNIWRRVAWPIYYGREKIQDMMAAMKVRRGR